MGLGRLEEIDVRKVWAHEQYDFSKWLSSEDNIKLLGDTLNLSLTDIETEKFVGSYRCDIIGKDELTGKTVLIENQLESTNHDHLGKIITYASGLDASVVVWIVASVRDEHASAIEWINKNTTDDLSFFLIEVHAYKIGNSDTAPMFKIVEQPNDFSKRAKTMAKAPEINESQTKRLEFWNKFNDYIDSVGKPINKHKATTDHWYTVAIGSSQCHISIELVNREHKIRVGLWIPNNKELFDKLYNNKEQIEQSAGLSFGWDRLEGKKASVISTKINGLNFNHQENYPELMEWILQKVLLFKRVFVAYL